jgi:hypothetical protein
MGKFNNMCSSPTTPLGLQNVRRCQHYQIMGVSIRNVETKIYNNQVFVIETRFIIAPLLK